MLNIFKIISVLALILASVGASAQCAGMAGGVCLGTNGQPYNGYNGQGNYQPQHHWTPNWGAIAIDPENNQYYSTRDEISAKSAANKVLNYCNAYNHTDKCEMVGRAYANICVAMAWGIANDNGDRFYNLKSSTNNQQEADDKAIAMCKKDPVHDCVVDYHDCLFPKQID